MAHPGDNGLTGLEIAVIGMAVRFSKAKNINEFWNNLKKGKEFISFFTNRELQEAGIESESLKNPHYVKANGILEDIECFDSSFFGYTSVEAALMDPQTRISHECAWEALEDAGYASGNHKGRIGVYVGAASHLNWEVLSVTSENTKVLGGFNSWQLYDKDFISTRLSYNLDLKGPAITINTACSTSLVAVHLACQGLLSGECHMALAGGVKVMIPGKTGYPYQEGMVFSSDGHCRTFDAKADGTIFGEGVGIVVLKPLEKAIAHRDFIYAVIKSSAINNDGKSKVGYTAPSVKGQTGVIRSALRLARVKPESIGYIEAHGTGTNLGDPAEVEALTRALNTDKKGFCRIGSVKSNLGHLDTAAGVAGLIKTVLALKHKQIPPSLHFETPNPKIDFENSPFIVSTELYQWKNNGHPLRAGISSFGAGGTNAHVILEEAPRGTGGLAPLSTVQPSREYQLILLSAKTESALDRMTGNFVEYLKKNPHIKLADAAYSLAVGRKAFKHRKMVVTSSVRETIAYLSDPDSGKVHEFTAEDEDRPVVFMFSGQGSQYVNMGWELYQAEDVFRQEMDRCLEILTPLTGYDIKEILYPSPGASTGAEARIYHQDVVQPLMFILEYALARLLMHWGIQPYAMIGYSIGEYVAACLSGVFSLEDALRIVVLRGKLMHEIPGGTMISVPLPEKDLLPLLKDQENISIAVVNGPSCIVSGPDEDIREFEKQLKEKRLLSIRLSISHAGHSQMMDPMLDKFHHHLKQTRFEKPKIPYISTLTGQWITVEQAADPMYWTRHLRETVRFVGGITELLQEENAIFVEIGPGNVLSTVVNQHPGKKAGQQVLNLIKYPDQKISGPCYLLTRIALLWLYGRHVDWEKFYKHEKRYRIPLPTYPFDKYAYPLDMSSLTRLMKGEGVSLLQKPPVSPGKQTDIADWFYLPSWKPSMLHLRRTHQQAGETCLLVFKDNSRLGHLLVLQLKQEHHQPDLVIVERGTRFSTGKDGRYRINPAETSHYSRLLEALQSGGKKVSTIVHLWNVTPEEQQNTGMEWVETCQDSGYYSLAYLAQAMGNLGMGHEVKIIVLSSSMQGVPGSPLLYPEKATMLGPIQIIPREYPNIRCRSVDIVLPVPSSREERQLLSRLMEELTIDSPDTIVAYRGNQRLVQAFEPFRWEKTHTPPPRLKEKGVYLVTGGLGGVGLVLAEFLAVNLQARVILTGRTPFPPKEEWEQWLSQHEEADPLSGKIRKLQKMEEKGGEVLVCQADASNFQQMEAVFHQAKDRFGRINGIIHCALHLDGALIHRVTREMTSRVFAPRVKGTLVLKQLMEDHHPDFFVLCSSLSSILGNPGEVVYCATNTFLDAFAYHMHTHSANDVFTVSINWDAWQEVGGAVEMAKRMAGSLVKGKHHFYTVDHPLLQTKTQTRSSRDGNRVVYISRLNPSKHWVLDEHRVMGKAALPGTAYLEMAQAAFENHIGNGSVEIREFYITSPLFVEDDEEKEVQIILEKQGDGFECHIISRAQTGKDQWQEHARGTITGIGNESPPHYDIRELEVLCPEEEIIVPQAPAPAPKGLTTFGPRWLNNTKKKRSGKDRQLTVLELDTAFLNDIDVYKLHPALLDCALPTPGNMVYYAPFSYKRIKIYDHLPRKIFSYIRHPGNHNPKSKTLVYDISIMDEEGIERLQVEEYTLLEISGQNLGAAPVNSTGVTGIGGAEDEWIKTQLQDGLVPAEGIDVFTRVLEGTLPRVLVSTQELEARLHENKNPVSPGVPGMMEEVAKLGPIQPRPELSTRYAAPRNETEKMLTEIWQKLLGIDRVGIHDNFFDLGATSMAIMHSSRLLKDSLGKDIPIVSMYIYPTVGELAQFLDQEETGAILTAATPVDGEKKSNKKNKLKQRKRKINGEKYA